MPRLFCYLNPNPTEDKMATFRSNRFENAEFNRVSRRLFELLSKEFSGKEDGPYRISTREICALFDKLYLRHLRDDVIDEIQVRLFENHNVAMARITNDIFVIMKMDDVSTWREIPPNFFDEGFNDELPDEEEYTDSMYTDNMLIPQNDDDDSDDDDVEIIDDPVDISEDDDFIEPERVEIIEDEIVRENENPTKN